MRPPHTSRQPTMHEETRNERSTFSRRDALIRGAAVTAAAALGITPIGAAAAADTSTHSGKSHGDNQMPTITTKDGVEIFYKDWGTGQPIVFSHGWPLSADDWDAQMLFFLKHGYRVIAHDRRGH